MRMAPGVASLGQEAGSPCFRLLSLAIGLFCVRFQAAHVPCWGKRGFQITLSLFRELGFNGAASNP